MSLGRRVLVPVANPASVTPLLALAAHLCDPDGEVIPVTVLPGDADDDEVTAAERGLRLAATVVRDRGRRAEGRLVRASRPVDGVLEAVAFHDATLVVIGWRGRSSTTTVFGELIDSVVGRSSVPLAVARLGASRWRRVLLPVGDDHLLPAGRRGLDLAADLTGRLAATTDEPATVLRTGRTEAALPASVGTLGDRIHHDPRRTHLAVGAAARADDAIVAPVAPTVSGLRAATTHLAWAAPDATLLVAVDPGPTEQGIVEAVRSAGAPAPRRPHRATSTVRIRVSVGGAVTVGSDDLQRVLAPLGAIDGPAPARAPRGRRPTTGHRAPQPTTAAAHASITVDIAAASTNEALATVMEALHNAPELRGAEITYDVEHVSAAVAVVHGDLAVRTVPPGELDVIRSTVGPEPDDPRSPRTRSRP